MRRFALLLLCATLAGCASTPEEPLDCSLDANLCEELQDGGGIIRGVVVDAAINPVVGAVISLGAFAEDVASDEDGAFLVTGLTAGLYQVEVAHPLYHAVQTSATVEAGVVDPPLLKIQLDRLFDLNPYMVQQQLEGFINCGYSIGLQSPCIIDYTQLLPPCPGGCVQELYGISGDVRRFVVPIDDGWQTRVNEMVWQPSQGTSPSLSMSVSFFNRTSGHSYDRAAGVSPLRQQMDVEPGVTHPEWIPEEGLQDYLVYINPSTTGSALPVAAILSQPFDLFVTTFYYGAPPEEWSFVSGDGNPF